MTLEEMARHATDRGNADHPQDEQAWMRTVEICERLERIADVLSDLREVVNSIYGGL